MALTLNNMTWATIFVRLSALLLLLTSGANAGCFEKSSCTNCLTTFGCHWCQLQNGKAGECNFVLSDEYPPNCPTITSTNWVSSKLECPAPAAPILPEISSWMSGAMEFIGDKTLLNITVPGTHDSLSQGPCPMREVVWEATVPGCDAISENHERR